MSLRITDDCINCGACEIECPKSAVFPKQKEPQYREPVFTINLSRFSEFVSSEHFYIDPYKCNNCESFYSAPRCIDVCPLPCSLMESKYVFSEIGGLKHNPVLNAEISLN